MNIGQAKDIPLTHILLSIGSKPERSRDKRLFYFSPFRSEKVPSFMVNTETNTWVDFGASIHGDVLDFVMYFAGLDSVSSALAWLANKNYNISTANTTTIVKFPKQIAQEKAITPADCKVQPLQYRPLLDYMAQRGITGDVAARYCKEVWYQYNGKRYFGIAFPTRTGSFEVRNRYDKRCIGHKDITIIRICKEKQTSECCVFEGFTDFLSYVVLFRKQHPMAQSHLCDCIVLNSVSNLRKALSTLEEYTIIHCYLDNDDAGRTATAQIEMAFSRLTIDESPRYGNVNDVNDYLIYYLGLKKEEETCKQ